MLVIASQVSLYFLEHGGRIILISLEQDEIDPQTTDSWVMESGWLLCLFCCFACSSQSFFVFHLFTGHMYLRKHGQKQSTRCRISWINKGSRNFLGVVEAVMTWMATKIRLQLFYGGGGRDNARTDADNDMMKKEWMPLCWISDFDGADCQG